MRDYLLLPFIGGSRLSWFLMAFVSAKMKDLPMLRPNAQLSPSDERRIIEKNLRFQRRFAAFWKKYWFVGVALGAAGVALIVIGSP